MAYRFEKVTRDDFPMLRHWLSEPHVGGWWGDPEEELALIEKDLVNGPTDMRIVHADAPFAFVQDYPHDGWPAPQYAGYPAGTRAMDTFLGAPAYLGKGHAQAYLRQRALELIAAGAPCVVTDPDPENARGVATWRGAGFCGDRVTPCEDGDPVLVLEFDRAAPGGDS